MSVMNAVRPIPSRNEAIPNSRSEHPFVLFVQSRFAFAADITIATIGYKSVSHHTRSLKVSSLIQEPASLSVV